MTFRYNSTMLPRVQISVCLSCWRRLPLFCSTSKSLISHKYSILPLCSFTCGLSWTRRVSSTAASQQKSVLNCGFTTEECPQLRLHNRRVSSTAASQQKSEEKDMLDITKNSYYIKYQEKLKHLSETDPDDYKSKIKEMTRKEQELKEARKEDLSQPPNLSDSQAGLGAWPPKNLNEIMKVDLLKDKTTDEIERIWAEYHATKDCVFAVVKDLDYDDMMEKSHLAPAFIYPLPRQDGFEFYLAQFFQNTVYFTSLGMYQIMKENAPPCLVLAHFTEFKVDKGIVLMAGQYDNNVLSKKDALNLVKQMAVFYGRSAPEKFCLVQQFNRAPEQFQYQDLVEEYKKLKHAVES